MKKDVPTSPSVPMRGGRRALMESEPVKHCDVKKKRDYLINLEALWLKAVLFDGPTKTQFFL